MATHQTGGTSRTQGSENAAFNPSTSTAPQGYAQAAGQRADQERPRQVNQERGAPGTDLQRGASRQGGAGVVNRTAGQPSLLPAFMAQPGLMASAFMSDPFAFAQVMNQEMDRLFNTFSNGPTALTSAQEQGGARQSARGVTQWNPTMEVLQRANELAIRADLPGLSPDDVNIDIEDGVLTISGERQQKEEERKEGYFRSERSYGAFARSIALPEGADEEQVKARFDNGVLEVTVPLPQQQRPRARRVEIQGGASASHVAGSAQAPQADRQPSAPAKGTGNASTSQTSNPQQQPHHA